MIGHRKADGGDIFKKKNKKSIEGLNVAMKVTHSAQGNARYCLRELWVKPVGRVNGFVY